jgi:hypothetical protein
LEQRIVAKISIPQFDKIILNKLGSDVDQVVSELATFINENVIDRKWQENFPGHELSPATIKKKGNDRIGVKSGDLRRQATLWTTWSIFNFVPGGIRPAMIKKKHGLTAYSNMVKTNIGGELDFLGVDSKDITNIQSAIQRAFAKRNYKGSGQIRVMRK